jgi:hypothetical protein
LKVTAHVYDGTLDPVAVIVKELDALFDDTVDCALPAFHDIVAEVVTSELRGKEYPIRHCNFTS